MILEIAIDTAQNQTPTADSGNGAVTGTATANAVNVCPEARLIWSGGNRFAQRCASSVNGGRGCQQVRELRVRHESPVVVRRDAHARNCHLL